MKLVEVCSCTASFEADGKADEVTAAMDAWRVRHRCDGVNRWERSAASSTAGEYLFGLAMPADEARAKGIPGTPPGKSAHSGGINPSQPLHSLD